MPRHSGDKNIGGLDIAVDDAFGMRGVERIGNLNRQAEQNIRLDRPSGNAMLQRYPVQKLHGDERLPILLPNVINRADVGMIECGRGLSFTLKTGEGLRVACNFIRQELEQRWSRVSSALKTTPMPPPPSFSTMR